MATTSAQPATGPADSGTMPNGTPTPSAWPCCDHCTEPSAYRRRDTAGNTHVACAAHTREMEVLVREINEWDGEHGELP